MGNRSKSKISLVRETISRNDIKILDFCDKEFEACNPSFFVDLLQGDASVAIRIRAVCILAEIGNQNSVTILSNVVRDDDNPLVRHEAAFTLGQLGYSSAVPALIDAMLHDENILVRHESAAALGSIGDQSARGALINATLDGDEFVAQSAIVALLNLDYLDSRDGVGVATAL